MASSRVLYLVVLIALFLRVQGDEFYVCGATSPTSPSDPPPIDPLNLPYKELLMNLSTPVLSCNKSSCTEGETFFEVSACSKDAGINWYWYGSADFQDPLPNKTILVQAKIDVYGKFICNNVSTELTILLQSIPLTQNPLVITNDSCPSTCDCANCADKLTFLTSYFEFGIPTYESNAINRILVQPGPDSAVCISAYSVRLYYASIQPELLLLEPMGGPISGNTTVNIQGVNLDPSQNITCKFGTDGVEVVAKTVNNTSISCTTPAVDSLHFGMKSVFFTSNTRPTNGSLHYFYYRSPTIENMMPTTVTYSNGALQEVLIIGQEFIPRGEFQLKIDVKFGDELSKQVRVINATALSVLPPDGPTGEVNVSVSLNGQQWQVSPVVFSYGTPPATSAIPFYVLGAVLGVFLIIVVVIVIVKIVMSCNRKKMKGSTTMRTGEEKVRLLDTNQELGTMIRASDLKMGKRIGKGNFGEVFLAEWKGTEVAVKRVPASRITPDFKREFEREAELMVLLRHPNVVQFIGTCFEPEDICIVTEYMSKGSLYHIIHNKEQDLPISLIKAIALDACRGMAYLHYREVIHRDLKSHNLLVDENWKVKVCDFGLSKKVEDLSKQMTACGTPCWTAPEILRNARYSTKADVYSFGVVLWEMVTRAEPFSGMPPFQIIFAVGQKRMRPVIPPSCPTEMKRLIELCWQDDPNLRPTFSEIIDYLNQWQTDDGIEDEPVSTL